MGLTARCLMLTSVLLPALSWCGTIPVAPGESVQAALDRAGPGDTVLLRAGIHRERVTMTTNGRHGSPIVLAGERGAILDGSEPVDLDWQPADDVAPAAWRCRVDFLPFVVAVEGRLVTMLREDRVDPSKVKDPSWHWQRLFRDGVGPSGWRAVRALGLYVAAKKELLLKFGDQLDPRRLAILIAPRGPAVHITGADRCVVRDLAIRNAAYGVLIEDSTGSVVEGCRIGPVDYGVWLGQGSYACTLRFNEIFRDSYAVTDTWIKASWDNWMAHKRGGFYDRYGIQIHRTAGLHRVHDNHIHDTWDGIEDQGGPSENQGLDIHHNLIERIADDGLEPNGGEVDCRWHDNIVANSICGFRIKAPTVGPLYAYRNIFLDNREDYRNFGEKDLKPAKVYVYHNTSTSGRAIHSNKIWGVGTPNYHYGANLFWCQAWWGNSGKSVNPNWWGDYNVYCRRGEAASWERGKELAAAAGLDRHSLWTEADPGFRDLEARDVSLLPTSPARGRAGDVAAALGVSLPGLSGTSQVDAGAVQFGESMPVLPRKRASVDVPVAGAWPGPDAVAPVPWVGVNLFVNGSFEEGPAGWERIDPPTFTVSQGVAAADGHFLFVDARLAKSDCRHVLDGLTPGQTYYLVYSSRNSTIDDMRIIVRNMADSHYVSSGGANPGKAWGRTSLSFVMPDAPLRLELSPRTEGVCELDGFAIHRAK